MSSERSRDIAQDADLYDNPDDWSEEEYREYVFDAHRYASSDGHRVEQRLFRRGYGH